MPHNFFYAALEFARWILAIILAQLSLAYTATVADAVTAMMTYFTSAIYALLVILLFWFGPIISLRLFAVILGAMIAIETLPGIILAVLRFIKTYIPFIP